MEGKVDGLLAYYQVRNPDIKTGGIIGLIKIG